MTDKKEIGLTKGQQNAYDAVMRGEDVFVSGAAGVGKSYLLSKIISDLKNVGKQILVTAPTGVASLNIHGSTCHRVFGWPDPSMKPEDYHPKEEIVQADVVIVDEVSMARVDLFDRIYNMVQAANKKRIETGKPKIQMVLSGDFAQLPPVTTDKDRKVLAACFPDVSGVYYAFEHRGWNYKTYNLDEVVRQENPKFAEALNKIRLGDPDRSGIKYINEHRSKQRIEGAISVLTKNADVDAENVRRVEALPGEKKVFVAKEDGKVEKGDKKAPDTLVLKEGARVVALINDSDNAYVNGSQGSVTDIDEYAEKVTVKFDNGSEVDFGPYKWEITEPEIVKDKDGRKKLTQKVIGTFTQIPLKHAYAVTVHKSQGQTYDSENANPKCWDFGQLYTQLSRVTNVENLYLNRDLKPGDVKAAPIVVGFYGGYKKQKTTNESNTSLNESRENERKNKSLKEKKKSKAKMNEDKTTTTSLEVKKEEEVKEIATPKTIRVTQSVFDEMREVFESIGAKNQTIGLKTILEGYKSACAINASTGTDQDALESVMTAVATITDEVRVLLDRKAQVQTAAELAVRTQIESKDKAISDLQIKYDNLKETSDKQKTTIAELKPIADKVERYQAERDKAVSDSEKAIREADETKANLTSTIAYQSVQIQKLQDELASLPTLESEKARTDRDNERLQDKLHSAEEIIERLSDQVKDLQGSLDEEKKLRATEKDEYVMEVSRRAQDALDEKEAAIEKAKEKEEERWQRKIDKLEAKRDEEREAYANDRKELERMKMEKAYKIDPKMAELEETIKRLEMELEDLRKQKDEG